MKKMQRCTRFWTMCTVIVGAQASVAEMVSVTETGKANGYGDFSGLAIDFDSSDTDAPIGSEANWIDDLQAGESYFVESITVFNRNSSDDTAYFLGVYTSLVDNVFGGFLGVSDNSQVISGDPGPRTWDFTNIVVEAGSTAGNGFTAAQDDFIPGGTEVGGDGMVFFLLQTDANPLAAALNVGNSNGIERIDGDAGSIDVQLAGILHGGGGAPNTIKLDRVPEYLASVRPVPEPASAALAVFACLVSSSICRRR